MIEAQDELASFKEAHFPRIDGWDKNNLEYGEQVDEEMPPAEIKDVDRPAPEEPEDIDPEEDTSEDDSSDSSLDDPDMDEDDPTNPSLDDSDANDEDHDMDME